MNQRLLYAAAVLATVAPASLPSTAHAEPLKFTGSAFLRSDTDPDDIVATLWFNQQPKFYETDRFGRQVHHFMVLTGGPIRIYANQIAATNFIRVEKDPPIVGTGARSLLATVPFSLGPLANPDGGVSPAIRFVLSREMTGFGLRDDGTGGLNYGLLAITDDRFTDSFLGLVGRTYGAADMGPRALVPEPGSVVLVGLGVCGTVGMAVMRRRRAGAN